MKVSKFCDWMWENVSNYGISSAKNNQKKVYYGTGKESSTIYKYLFFLCGFQMVWYLTVEKGKPFLRKKTKTMKTNGLTEKKKENKNKLISTAQCERAL